jgi:hypothetical protein
MKNYQEDLINAIINNDDDGIKEYLVKWKGYTKRYNCWIKESDFIEKDILIEYNKDLMEEKY